MHTTPEFIAARGKHAGGTEFAAFIRGLTSSALPLRVPFGSIESMPQMTELTYQSLLDRNRRALSAETAPAVARPAGDTAEQPKPTPRKGKLVERLAAKNTKGDGWEWES